MWLACALARNATSSATCSDLPGAPPVKGIEVSVCGEVAANPVAAFMLIGMKVTSLSVGPASLAEIKKVIRSVTFAEAEEAVRVALRASTADEVLRTLTTPLESVLDISKFGGAWNLSRT